MSCGTLVPATAFSFSLTRLLRSLAPLSNGVQLTIASVDAGPQPRGACSSVWAIPSSLAATMGIDLSFSSSGYLDVSVPRVPSAYAMYLRMGDWSSTSRVSPFGYQGIYACLRLPLAFRSLPRPSSALGALASTLCSSSLDYVDPETRYIYFRLLSNLFFATGLSRLFSSFFLVQLSRCVGDLSPSLPILSFGSGLSLPFGILKTIQMIERQFFLRTLFRALPLSQLSFVRFDCLFYASFPPRNRPRFETSAFASVCSLERR